MGRGQVGAFPKRLKAILKAKGGHIEHFVSGRGTYKSSCSHAAAEAPLVADPEDWQKNIQLSGKFEREKMYILVVRFCTTTCTKLAIFVPGDQGPFWRSFFCKI